MQDKLIQAALIRCQALQANDQLWVLKGNLTTPPATIVRNLGGGIGSVAIASRGSYMFKIKAAFIYSGQITTIL